MDVNTNYPDSIKYINNFLRGNTMVVTKDFLESRNLPCTASIPIYPAKYINESKNTTQEKIENIMFTEVLSLLQHELKSWHDKLFHLHLVSMFRLENLDSSQKDF